MQTSGYVMQGKPNPDGHIFIDATDFDFPTGGSLTPFRSGVGLTGVTIPASATTTVDFSLNSWLFRYGMQDDSQMQFGQNNGTSGANALPLLPGTNFRTPYTTQSRPPIASNQLFGANTGASSVIPKGITVNTINLVYQVLGVALTSATIGLTKTQYANAAAPVVTNLLAAANNGILLPVAAQPLVTSIPVTAANQIMLTSRFAKYILETVWTTPAGSTVGFIGAFLDVSYNFN